MTTSVYPSQTGNVSNTEAAVFIPEIWSDEVIAAYELNLVVANLVKKMSMVGKKGDTIHIPKPTRGTATAKVAKTAVTIQSDVEPEVLVLIDQHFEYSRMIEDITEAQALSSLRAFYTGDAGYALARNVDSNLHALATSFGGGAGGTGAAAYVVADAFIPSATGVDDFVAAAGSAAFTDASLRAIIRKMDDVDTPMDGRSWVIPPAGREQIMGIDRYVSSDFVNSGAVPGGKIGQLYGVDVVVTTNAVLVETAAKASLLIHKDTMVLAEQKGVRSQTQYKQEFLGTLYTADRLYGTKVVRPETGFILILQD